MDVRDRWPCRWRRGRGPGWQTRTEDGDGGKTWTWPSPEIARREPRRRRRSPEGKAEQWVNQRPERRQAGVNEGGVNRSERLRVPSEATKKAAPSTSTRLAPPRPAASCTRSAHLDEPPLPAALGQLARPHRHRRQGRHRDGSTERHGERGEYAGPPQALADGEHQHQDGAGAGRCRRRTRARTRAATTSRPAAATAPA